MIRVDLVHIIMLVQGIVRVNLFKIWDIIHIAVVPLAYIIVMINGGGRRGGVI